MKQYPTTGQDLFNSIAQGYNSNAVMQYVLRLKGKIDFELLKKAVEFSLYMEPVLECRFVKNASQPRWESIRGSDKSLFCYKIFAEKPQKTIHEFLAKELSPETGVQVLVCLIAGKTEDILCLKICHAACDGCGSKYYVKLLAKLYTCLSQDPNYIPTKTASERSTSYL